MLKDITVSGRYMTVYSGTAGTYINGYSGLQGVGNMRFNTTNQTIEIYDGNNWIMLNTSIASVGLNSEAESLLDWARVKRNEEIAWKAMAEKSHAVKIALEKVEEAKRQLDVTAKLARDYEQTTS